MKALLGNFGSGKTTTILQNVLSLIKNDQKTMLIVPARQHKNQITLSLLQKQSGIIGNPVLTLSELQKKLIETLFPIPSQRPQSINNFEQFLIISSIITQHSFRFFPNLQQRPEIVKMVYRLIQSLREKDMEHLSSSPELKDKIDDLQLILTHYHQILKEKNLVDQKFQVDLICQNIHRLNADFFPDHVFIDGFVDYTATQFKLIQHIAQYLKQQQKSFTITFTDVPHEICQQTIAHFRTLFPDVEYTTLPQKPPSTELSDAFLTHSPLDHTNLELYEIQAFGKHKEVEYTTNQIKKLCIEKNYVLEDILILTNQQDTYSSLLASALRKANIPFSFGKDHPLSQNPLMIFIKRCIKIMTQELTHESLEFFAQSNYINASMRKILGKAPFLIPLAIQGKAEQWTKGFARYRILVQDQDDFPHEELNLLEKTIEELCHYLFALSPYQTYPVSQHISTLVDLLEFLGIQKSLSNTHDLVQHKKIIDLSLAKDYSALLKFKEILQELKKSLENISYKELSISSFLFFLGMISEETRYRSEIPQKDSLRILNPKDSRGIFAKAVFLLGLNESEWPSPPQWELFDHYDRHQLNLLSQKILGLPLWHTDTDYFSQEKLSFATALTRAQEKIFFSRTPVNERGVYFNSSHFLDHIIQKNLPMTILPYSPNPLIKRQNPAIFFKKHRAEDYYDSQQISMFCHQQTPNTNVQKAYRYTEDIKEANDYFDNQELPPSPLLSYFGYIPNMTPITQKYSNDIVSISPTRFERMGRCRYQGLWQDFWKLKAYQLPVYRPEAADYGNLYHQVLELYLQETLGQKEIFDETILQNILKKSIEQSPQRSVFLLDYHFIESILREFLLKIEPLLRDQEEPLYFELSSGTGELQNQIIPLNDRQSLKIYSRIDRINYDPHNRSYSIVDYKKSGISSYQSYQKTPFNLFQGFLYSALLHSNNKAPIRNISYVFLEKQRIFQEYPGTFARKPIFQSPEELGAIKNVEITRLLSLLSQGNFCPFTLESDIGEDLIELFSEKFGEKFPREHETKCAYCDLQKLCLRTQKKLKSF